MTAAQVHTLTPQTQAVLQSIEPGERVMAYVFAPQQEHPVMARFLETYQRETPQFQFQLLDADRDLDIAAQFGGQVEQNTVHLVLLNEQGEPVSKAPPEKLSAGSRTREHKLTNAILRLIRTPNAKIYYSVGHGEKPVDKTDDSFSKIIRLVSDTTLPVEPIRLTEGQIPDDAAMILIAGPTIDLFDFEKELLISYLEEGGKVFLLLDPIYGEGRKLENIQAVLEHVGLTAPNSFIVDPTGLNAKGSAFMPMVYFAQHPISEGTGGQPFLLDRARPLESLQELPDGVSLKAILHTSQQIWSEPANDLRSIRRPEPPEDPDAIKLHIASVSATKPMPEGRRSGNMRMVVIGDSDAFVDANHGVNGDASFYFLQTINWLREKEELLEIPPRFVESTPVTITKTQTWALFGSFLFLGLLITVGGTAWALVRRRTR